MTTYMICDGHGNQLCDGLDEYNVWSAARAHAARLGESVWVYGPDDDDAAEVAAPATRAPETTTLDGHTSEDEARTIARDLAAGDGLYLAEEIGDDRVWHTLSAGLRDRGLALEGGDEGDYEVVRINDEVCS